MKKFIIVFLFIFSVFFIQMNSASAFTGPYNYDINTIRVVDGYLAPGVPGKILQISGWAVSSLNGGEVNNIQPDYVLEMVNKEGEVVYTTTDTALPKPAYSSTDSSPHDFNQSYYEQYVGFLHYYQYTTNYQKAIAVRDSGNFMYINNYFSFGVGLDKLKGILEENLELRMNLIINQSGGDRTVYGVYFWQPAFSTKIENINAQSDSIEESAKNLDFFEIVDSVGKITTIVHHGRIQSSPNLGGAPLPGYYAGDSDFVVKERIVQYNRFANYNINTYRVYYYVSGGYAYDGGSNIGYIPSTWSAPFHGPGLRIIPKIDICTTDPVCTSLSESCPESCCDDLCEDGENADSPFCTKCNAPEPDPDVCLDEGDALKQYCCYHPEDKEMCSPGDGEYPEDEPVDKAGTCSTTKVTEVEFQYPQFGWGKSMVSNDACIISCQEELKAIFQPTQSVRAGMGFEYPVQINSSRYCVADYDNEGWQTKVDQAAETANNAYDEMESDLNTAKALDDACGTKTTLMATPTCPSSCGGRSGGTCTSCRCCSKRKCGSHPCPSLLNPSKTCCDTCNGCTRSVSCPSGYSYRSSLDACAKDVCSKNHSKTWSPAQSEIGSYISSAQGWLSIYTTNAATVSRLYGERSTCDNYVSNNQYTGASNTEITTSNVPNQTEYEITSSVLSEDTAYENSRINIWTDYSVYKCTNIRYTAPSLVGDHKSSIRSFTSTYCDYRQVIESYRDFWNKKSDAELKLEFSIDYYIQRYTGNIRDYSGPGYDYDGPYAYTDYYDPSEVHDFSINLLNLGPNLSGVANNLWKISPFTCQYDVTNLIFPPSGDPQNDLYGNVAFMYRQISLTDPFPDRSPGENWSGKESLITTKGYSVYGETPIYTIILNPSTMQGIRSYGTDYGSYYENNPYRSTIVENYIRSGVITKGR